MSTRQVSREQGFTLIELMLALSIVAALLAVTFGGLRVGLAAWRQGEDRAEAQQHVRSLVHVLGRSLASAYPYLATEADSAQPVVLFQGTSDRLALVTTAPPFPNAVAVAFTAVMLALEGDESPALAVRQKVLPNRDPFEVVKPILLDPAVIGVRFRFLRDAAGAWEERWDAAIEQRLPRAVEIILTTRLGGRTREHPPLTVSLPVSGS